MNKLDRLILRTINRYQRAGRSPTYREIGDILGYSAQHVHRRVKVLESQGLIERTPGAARSMRVNMKAPETTL